MEPEQVEIIEGVYYICNPVHRNRTPQKSQWTIDEEQEKCAFLTTYKRHWIVDNDTGWGFHFENGQVTYLGVAKDHHTPVFLAKFVNDSNHDTWHGYPVNYQKNQQDKPDVQILRQWFDSKPISAAKVRKIMRGQPCSL